MWKIFFTYSHKNTGSSNNIFKRLLRSAGVPEYTSRCELPENLYKNAKIDTEVLILDTLISFKIKSYWDDY